MLIATAQSSVTPDVRANGECIRSLMREASATGARLVHFPEGALSGYPSFDDQDWDRLRTEIATTCELAHELGLWTVVGSNHRSVDAGRPRNSLYVISDRGELVGRYDKRLCSFNETANHYDPGVDPLVFAIDGFRFGCALCIEVNFPELFTEYEQMGVDCVLFSAFADDPIFGVIAQAHAATNCFWISLSTAAEGAGRLPAGLVGPDGHWVARCAARAHPAVMTAPLDRTAPRFDVALNKARPWRRSTRTAMLACRTAEPVSS